jgi:photosystem II stability/assembly factor-like uncharacterized protein
MELHASGPRQPSARYTGRSSFTNHAVVTALTLACGCGTSAREPSTGDPGLAWTEIDAGNSTIEAFEFRDDQHAMLAASDGAWRGFRVTADAGATWQARELDVVPYGIGGSPSGTTTLAVGDGARPVWRSTDRGASFAPVEWGQHGWPASVRFFDDSTVIMGDQVGDRLFRSSDAGQTWTTYTFTREVLPGTRDIEILGNHAWVVGGPAYNGNGTGATIAVSLDSGSSWTIKTIDDQAHLFKGGSLHAIAVVSADEIWVAGENRQLYHTTDGMQTWTQIKGIPASFLHFGGIAVRGETIVVAGSVLEGDQLFGYGLYRSIDGGHTFEIADQHPGPAVLDGLGVLGVEQTPNGDLYVFGYDGLLWKYAGLMLGKTGS